jgi:hypothetical protein
MPSSVKLVLTIVWGAVRIIRTVRTVVTFKDLFNIYLFRECF